MLSLGNNFINYYFYLRGCEIETIYIDCYFVAIIENDEFLTPY